MAYLLDANTFIEAKNRYYSFDVCPGFWQWLELFANQQDFLTIKEVKDEILYGSDELSDWFKTIPSNLFIEADTEIQREFRTIYNHVTHNDYNTTAKNRFLDGADPWLIATAKQRNLSIVTHESSVPPNSTKIKIPNLCEIYEISCLNIFELLHDENVIFNLES